MSIARAKSYPKKNVTLRRSGCLCAAGEPGAVRRRVCRVLVVPCAARAHDQQFIASLHARLEPGARVLLLDNRYVEGNSTPVSEIDTSGNTYQLRTLADGSSFRVMKNFPTQDELRALLPAPVHYRELQYYWLAQYQVMKRIVLASGNPGKSAKSARSSRRSTSRSCRSRRWASLRRRSRTRPFWRTRSPRRATRAARPGCRRSPTTPALAWRPSAARPACTPPTTPAGKAAAKNATRGTTRSFSGLCRTIALPLHLRHRLGPGFSRQSPAGRRRPLARRDRTRPARRQWLRLRPDLPDQGILQNRGRARPGP